MHLVTSEIIDFIFLKADISVTDSLNPEWRGGFYFRNGFELLLPLRAVAKNLSELLQTKQIVVKSEDLFLKFVFNL